MIRIRLEGETWQDVQNQAREVAGMNRFVVATEEESQVDVPHEMVENTSPPVEPVDKGDGVTEFRPIPAIDALPQAPPPPASDEVRTVGSSSESWGKNWGDVDARGIPWDARIHAGNKATTKDGSWKRRRGVSVEEVQRIEAELGPAPVEPGHTPGVATGPAILDFQPAPPPPPAPAEAPVTFDQLMHVANQHSLGITNLNALTAEITGGQIEQVALIADKPAYIQAVYDRMTAS